MSTTHTFATIDLPTLISEDLVKCLVAASYTGPVVLQRIYNEAGDVTSIDIRVDESAVVWQTMKDDIAANHPPPGTLSHDAADPLVIAGDGVATSVVTITDPRGAAAIGKIVKLRIPPNAYVKVDADSFTLDGSGQQTATFGPVSGCTGDLALEFYYANGEVSPVSLTVRFGT